MGIYYFLFESLLGVPHSIVFAFGNVVGMIASLFIIVAPTGIEIEDNKRWNAIKLYNERKGYKNG